MKLFSGKATQLTVEAVLKHFLFLVKPAILGEDHELNDAENEILTDILVYNQPIVIKASVEYNDYGEYEGRLIYDDESLDVLKALIYFIGLEKTAKIGECVHVFDLLSTQYQQKILNLPVTFVARY